MKMNDSTVIVNFKNKETKIYKDIKMIFVNDVTLWLISDNCDNAITLNKAKILGFETFFE